MLGAGADLDQKEVLAARAVRANDVTVHQITGANIAVGLRHDCAVRKMKDQLAGGHICDVATENGRSALVFWCVPCRSSFAIYKHDGDVIRRVSDLPLPPVREVLRQHGRRHQESRDEGWSHHARHYTPEAPDGHQD